MKKYFHIFFSWQLLLLLSSSSSIQFWLKLLKIHELKFDTKDYIDKNWTKPRLHHLNDNLSQTYWCVMCVYIYVQNKIEKAKIFTSIKRGSQNYNEKEKSREKKIMFFKTARCPLMQTKRHNQNHWIYSLKSNKNHLLLKIYICFWLNYKFSLGD